MTNVRRTIGALTAALALGLTLTAAPAAQAFSDVPVLPVRTVCVRPDFTVTGSGWKVQAAIRDWNLAQSIIRLTTDLVPGCMVVPVHRDNAPGPVCGATNLQGIIQDGVHYSTHIEVYLNDACLRGENRSNAFIRSVIAHELGHVMGLDHNDSSRSVMGTERGIKRHRSVVAAVDVRDLRALYAALPPL